MLKKKRDVWKLVQDKMPKLKALFIFLSVATHFLLARPFGRIIYIYQNPLPSDSLRKYRMKHNPKICMFTREILKKNC